MSVVVSEVSLLAGRPAAGQSAVGGVRYAGGGGAGAGVGGGGPQRRHRAADRPAAPAPAPAAATAAGHLPQLGLHDGGADRPPRHALPLGHRRGQFTKT